MNSYRLLPLLLWTVGSYCLAQNVDPASDPWTYEAAFRQVLLGNAPLQSIVLWPIPLAEVISLLPQDEHPAHALWYNSASSVGSRFLPQIARHRFLATIADTGFR
ncbi:MAG: hypothetical protein ABDH31_04695, partial [Chlorobiota bacterium]